MAINITNVTGVDSFSDMGTFASDASGGWFWAVVTIALFVIIIFRQVNNRHNFDDAILSAAFTNFVVSMVFLRLGWVAMHFPIIYISLVAGVIGFKIYTK